MQGLLRRALPGLLAPLLTTRFRAAEEEHEPASNTEIETSINKVFLTSLQSEFESLKLFSLDAEQLGR